MQIERSDEVAEVATEIPYKQIKDGHGVEWKVIDLDKVPESIMPKSGVIVYELTRKNSRNMTPNIPYACTKDQNSGVLIGICIGVDNRSKELRWLRLSLGALNTLDLSVKAEREKAIVLKYSTIVEGSPNESNVMQVPKFRIYDAELAARNEMKRVMEGQRAVNIAMGLGGEDMFSMARNLGILTDRTSLPIITAEVLKRAEKDPKGFLQIWENPNRDLITILNRCLNTNVVIVDPMDGYHYDGRFLGHNEPAVFEYFKKYPDVTATLDAKSREKLKMSEKAMSKAAAPRDMKSLDAENVALKKQLEDALAKLSAQSPESISAQAAEEKDADPALLEELEALKAEGAKRKLKALHLYKPTRESLDKLKDKIAQTPEPIA